MQKVLSYVRRCIEDYAMIQKGDRVCVGVSGGKDSLVTLCALARLSAFFPERFEVTAVTLDMGYEESDFSGITELCERLGVAHSLVKTKIKEVVFDLRCETNPCSLCANMRRGALYAEAKRLGCNKAAYGHHMDDAVETFVLSLFYEGRISCFQPVTYLDRSDITLIRPMLYTPEKDIRRVVKAENLPVMMNPCPANGHTRRQEAKELIAELSLKQRHIKKHIFGAMQRLPIAGWGTDTPRRRRKSGIED